jgi:hypothetical protein
MLYFALTQSFVLLATIFLVTRKPGNNWTVLGVAAAAFVLALVGPAVTPVVLLQAIVTGVCAIVCGSIGAKPLAIRWLSVATMVMVYGLVILPELKLEEERQALRTEFPMVSLTPRLEYEAAATALPEPQLAEKIKQRMKEHEQKVRADSHMSFSTYTLRGRNLYKLHEWYRNGFIDSPGFGISRMPRIVMRRDIELPPVEPMTLPPPPYVPEASPDQAVELPLTPAKTPTQETLHSLHHAGQGDFLEPERMGYVRDRENVAGFMSHGFSKAPAIDGDAAKHEQWQLVKLELISLLKQAEPVAYVSESLPQMDQLQDVPTRSLDPFERQAIQQLREEEDLVIDAQPARLRMVGSLRATNDCRACHQVPRGTLLGAFTYELLPKGPPPATAKPDLPKA